MGAKDVMAGLIWTIVLLLAVLWFLGYSVDIGWWIHVLLVVALIGLLYNLLITPFLAARRPPADHPRDPEL
jgi:4-hydroxybenzoate polyprenyltransferase